MTVNGVFPPGATILFVGQAPGYDEVKAGRPFVGLSGQELHRWCHLAGIEYHKCGRTNVFNEPLPEGGLEEMTGPLSDGLVFGVPIAKGRYLKVYYEHHLNRLYEEIRLADPNIIVALGAEALWALSGNYEISKLRGTLFNTLRGDKKAIATFHPSFVLRKQFRQRNICVADLIKAKNNSGDPTLNMPKRELCINPSLLDLYSFYAYIEHAELLFIDIETDPVRLNAKGESLGLRQITHFGVASSPDRGICVPISFKKKSYWATAAEEFAAIKWIKAVCECDIPKALQNGLYDAQWLWELWGIRVRNYIHDTRLLHHALFPALPKDLGFIGSLWENEQAWKLLGHSKKGDD